MTLLDWVVFALYFAVVIALGFAANKRSKGISGFLVGNRRLTWWTIGLSVMATQASAITFIGTTGQAFTDGMEFIQFYFAQPLVMVVVCALFLPFFHRARIYTAYEFLERRFDAKTRSLTSFLFLVSRGMAAGIVLYAPSVVLSVLLGWDERTTILVMGAVTIFYTVAGGITAVIWTDAFQMLLMFAGVAMAVCLLLMQLPSEVSVADALHVGGTYEMWKSVDLSFDLNNTYTLWSGLIGGFFLLLAYFGCDQSQVQRYLTARSLTQNRLSLVLSALLKIPMQFFILATGVLLFVFYHFERPPLIFSPAENALVERSHHGEELARLQHDFNVRHAQRREAALALIAARKSGQDTHSSRHEMQESNRRIGELRTKAKELVRRERGTASNDVNYIFPGYLVRYVPAGVLGVMIAVIFAAAMSSLDSEIAALCGATVVDFYRRYWIRDGSDQHYVWISRLTVLLWGGVAVAMALYAGQLGSLIEAVNRVGSYFYGSLLGVFLLAFLVRWSNGTGAFYGLIAGMFSVFLVSRYTEISWLYYNVVGAVTVILVGALLSLKKKWSLGAPSAFILVLLFCASPALAQLQPLDEDQGVTGLGLALRKLPTVGSVLYITAHPDDENNAVLVKVSRGQGIRTGLLTLTRGDGGQNEIGTELFEALGILRTEELLAVHRFDGAQQFLTRAYEFGFSYSIEETLEKWGKEEILRDIVRVIRQFRPHVILSLNPEGSGGGLHHQASARLAAEAFRLAGDSKKFPEQITTEGLRPWRPLRLYQSGGPGQSSGRDRRPAQTNGATIDTGVFDPLLGESYAEYGARARSNHRSQGMNVLPRPGPASAFYRLADTVTPAAQAPGSENGTASDFFEGIDVSLRSLAQYAPQLESALDQLQKHVDRTRTSYDRSDYGSAADTVMSGLRLVRELRSRTNDSELNFFLERKERDFLNAAAKAHFIHFDALLTDSKDGAVAPGQEVKVDVAFLVRSRRAAEIKNIQLIAPAGWEVLPGSGRSYQVKVPTQAPYSQPYWYRPDLRVDRFAVQSGFTGAEPFAPAPLIARGEYIANGVPAWVEVPVQYRWFDADAAMERRMEVKVVPGVSVELSPAISILPTSDTPEWKNFQVTVQNNLPAPANGRAYLRAPAGWKVEPSEQPIDFRYENERVTVKFRLAAPDRLSEQEHILQAVAEVAGKQYDQGYQTIAYHHIQTRHLYHPAQAKLKAFDVKVPTGLRVGYVTGAGDEVGFATQELGASVTYLTEEDLASGDLSRFDVIVTGVRAYLNRGDLVAHNHRLLEYVRNGGHLVVQYNKYEFNEVQYGPYPARISQPHDRVTVEESPVRVLIPDHAVFNWPNRISEQDWQGWVQERGLYFLGQWDERYQPLVELQDPWPYNKDPKRGALVLAQYGKGTYIYTGLGFFRQLPEGIPGAYRLWANLLSLGRAAK